MKRGFFRLANKWRYVVVTVIMAVVLLAGGYIYQYEPFNDGFEITDELGGNIFPVTILSTATTDANLIVPADTGYIGNPKSCIAIRVKSRAANSKLRVEVAETPFLTGPFPNSFFPRAIGNILFIRISYGITMPCARMNRLLR